MDLQDFIQHSAKLFDETEVMTFKADTEFKELDV